MNTKRTILSWATIFVLILSVTCAFSVVTAAESESGKKSGGLFGEMNLFGRDKAPKESKNSSTMVKKKKTTAASGKTGLFSQWGKKSNEAEELPPPTADMEGQIVIIDDGVPVEYEDSFDQPPPINPAYGEVQEEVMVGPPPAVDNGPTSTKLTETAAQARSANEAPLPEDLRMSRSMAGMTRPAPQLTLARQEISAKSLGDPSQRLASPTWDVLDRNFLKGEHTDLDAAGNAVDFSDGPLPPLPDEVIQQAHIGAGVHLENRETENEQTFDVLIPPVLGAPLPQSDQEPPQLSREEFRTTHGGESHFRTNVHVTDNHQQPFSTAVANNQGSRERPIIEINTSGPPQIAVGSKVTYEIDLKNSGDYTAEDIRVNIKIPRWVEVVHATGSAGGFDLRKMPDQELSVGEWSVGDVHARRQEKLMITVIPREKRAFDLDVTWKSQQSSTLQRVIVEEPKLELELIGKDTAILGRPEAFTLKIHNIGNCTAEDTSFFVISDGDDSGPAIAQLVGSIPAGQMRTHNVQFLAKQPGRTNFRVRVTTKSGTEVSAEKSVQIQYSTLKLRTAPITPQYVGAESVYRLYVSNMGTASTTDARMMLEFPSSMELVSRDKNQGGPRGRVEWELGGISPGETREFSVTLRPTMQGEMTLKLDAESKYSAPVRLEIPVDCYAMANMKMELKVPEKPLLMREMGEYQIQITNTGSEIIHDGVVQFFFSEGLEPLDTPGAVANANGVVRFESHPLNPGATRTFTVHARGVYTGKHSIRAQVSSATKDLDLLEQKSTFYR